MIGSPSKLIVAGLDAAYGRAQVLYDVALDVGAGEAVALVGRNGAGKSTTLRSILGLIANCNGEIIFDNAPISHLPAYERVQRGLGYVPEDRRIFADLTVDENLEVGRQRRRHGQPGDFCRRLDWRRVGHDELRRRGDLRQPERDRPGGRRR